jgi:tetratricopeptide (TPR) repeat protein
MRNKYYILILLIVFFSCKSQKKLSFVTSCVTLPDINVPSEIKSDIDELNIIENTMPRLYLLADNNPEHAIFIADSILQCHEKTLIKRNYYHEALGHLHYLKGELYYKIGDYENSIRELKTDNYISCNYAAAMAANYVKLKQYDKAKCYVDSIGQGYYIYDYALGNYYESIRDKEEALKIYRKIKENKSIKHYAYYKLAVSRLEQLEKNNPVFLDEIYYPTGNPTFEICNDDNENRIKIFDVISKIPEVKACKECNSTMIHESPQENDKDYYWVKVGPGDFLKQTTKYNFFVYEKTFVVKFYDEHHNKIMSLEEWRTKKR